VAASGGYTVSGSDVVVHLKGSDITLRRESDSSLVESDKHEVLVFHKISD